MPLSTEEFSKLQSLQKSLENNNFILEIAKRDLSLAQKDIQLSQLNLQNFIIQMYRKYNLSDKDTISQTDGSFSNEVDQQSNENNEQKKDE